MTDLMTNPAHVSGDKSLTVLSREATAKAFEKHLLARANYAGTWDAMADHFAEDATYRDAFYGEMKGRETIRTWLRTSMEGIEDWSYPVLWNLVGEGRVVVHWLNRLPGSRPDGTFYEFPGVSCISFGPDGKIIRQVDMYDSKDALKVVFEAKTGTFGRFIIAIAHRLGAIGRECVRKVFFTRPGLKHRQVAGVQRS